MATARRRRRTSSSESSDGLSSSEDDVPSTTMNRSSINKLSELTLKDDEDTIDFQVPLPEDDGKRKMILIFVC